MGHIVSKEGTKIDLDRVIAMKNLELLISKNEIQSFHGIVNFLRRFVLNFA